MAQHQRPRHNHPLFKKKRWWIILIIVLIVLTGGVAYARQNQHKDTTPRYQTMRVGKQADFALTGKVAANEQQVLTLPEGKLQSLNVKDGDHVVQGQTILTTYYDASQDPTTDTDNASPNAAANDNQSDQAAAPQIVRRTNTLTAPYSGYVSVDQSKQGQPVITLYSDSLQFAGKVSEYDYSKLHNGTNLHVKALATNHTETTPVNYLSLIPAKDSGNNAKYKVTANLNPQKFMIGQTLRATIAQDGVRIPNAAVVHHHVYIVDSDGRARYAKVSGHAVNGSFIATDGVDAGDKIVTNPDHQLKNHMRINQHD